MLVYRFPKERASRNWESQDSYCDFQDLALCLGSGVVAVVADGMVSGSCQSKSSSRLGSRSFTALIEQLEEFVDSIHLGSQPEVGAPEAIADMCMMRAVFDAQETGQAVVLS